MIRRLSSRRNCGRLKNARRSASSPFERVVGGVQVVVDLPDGARLETDVEERLGVDPGRRLRDVLHSLVATSSTTSRARRRWSSSWSSRLRSRADAWRVSSIVTCFSSSTALARSRSISFLALSRSAPISSCAVLHEVVLHVLGGGAGVGDELLRLRPRLGEDLLLLLGQLAGPLPRPPRPS